MTDTISNTEPLRAFHAKEDVKKSYLDRVKAHSAANEVLPGPGAWDGKKGSLIGVTIHGTDVGCFEREVGIDAGLLFAAENWWRLAFYAAPLHVPAWEKLDPSEVEDVRRFPSDWLDAVAAGADTRGVPKALLLWCLEQTLLDIDPAEAMASELAALVADLLAMHREHSPPGREAWRGIRRKCVAFRDAVPSFGVLASVAATVEAAAWPLGSSGTTVADTMEGHIATVRAIVMAKEGWSEGDEGVKAGLEQRMNAMYEKVFAIEDPEERAKRQHEMRQELDDDFDREHPGHRDRSISLSAPTGLAKWERLLGIRATLLKLLEAAPLPLTPEISN